MSDNRQSENFHLRIESGGETWDFIVPEGGFTLGRTDASDIVVPIRVLSSIHLEFVRSGNEWGFMDRNSTNGTAVNGVKLVSGKIYHLPGELLMKVGKMTMMRIAIFPVAKEAPAPLPPEPAPLPPARPAQVHATRSFVAPQMIASSQLAAGTPNVEAPRAPPALQVVASEPALVEPQRNVVIENHLKALEHRLQIASTEEDIINERLKKTKIALAATETFCKLEEEKLREHRERTSSGEALAKETAAMLKELHDKVEQSNAKLEGLKIETELAEKKISKAERDLAEIEKKTSVLQNDSRHLTDEKSKLRKDCDQAILELKAREEEIKTRVSELSAKASERSELDGHIGRLKAEVEKLREENKDLRTDRIEQEKLAEKSKLEEEVAKLGVEKLAREQAQREAESQSLGQMVEALRADHVRLTLERDETLRLIDDLKKQHQASLGQCDALYKQIKIAEEAALIANENKKSAQSTFENLSSEVSAYDERLKRISLECDEKRALADKHKVEIEAAEKAIAELTLSLNVIRSQEATAAESFNRLRSQKEAELLLWEKGEKDKVQEKLQNAAAGQERKLAEYKTAEMAAIDGERAAWLKEKAQRAPFETREITRASGDLFTAHLSNSLGGEKLSAARGAFLKDVEDIVKSVLTTGGAADVQTHLKSMVAQTPESLFKSKNYWKKIAMRGGIFLTVLALCLAFPEYPTLAVQTVKNFFNRKSTEPDYFVEKVKQARANRPKFLPVLDKVFRPTYTENIIYLDGYGAMKTDEQAKKQWTVELNKFFVEKLELGDQAIVNYIGIEGPLVSELEQMAQIIKPETQVGEIAHMKDFEDQARGRLIESVKGEANFNKIRELEADFYRRFSSKL